MLYLSALNRFFSRCFLLPLILLLASSLSACSNNAQLTDTEKAMAAGFKSQDLADIKIIAAKLNRTTPLNIKTAEGIWLLSANSFNNQYHTESGRDGETRKVSRHQIHEVARMTHNKQDDTYTLHTCSIISEAIPLVREGYSNWFSRIGQNDASDPYIEKKSVAIQISDDNLSLEGVSQYSFEVTDIDNDQHMTFEDPEVASHHQTDFNGVKISDSLSFRQAQEFDLNLDYRAASEIDIKSQLNCLMTYIETPEEGTNTKRPLTASVEAGFVDGEISAGTGYKSQRFTTDYSKLKKSAYSSILNSQQQFQVRFQNDCQTKNGCRTIDSLLMQRLANDHDLFGFRFYTEGESREINFNASLVYK